MSDEDSAGLVGVAQCLWADVLRLALAAGSGKLRHTEILAAAARGGLFIDLVDHGLIALDDGALAFADAPDDSVPLAKQLMTELRQHPDRTFSAHLQRGRPHLGVFVDALVESGIWTRHGPHLTEASAEYDDPTSVMSSERRDALKQVASGTQPAQDAREATLAAFATVLHLYPGNRSKLIPPPDLLWPACNHLDWIVRDVTTYLYDAQATDLAAGSADGATNAWQIGAV